MDSKPGALTVLLFLGFIACESPPADVVGPEPAVSASPPVPELAVVGAPPVLEVVGGGSVVREDIEGLPQEIYGLVASLGVDGRVSGQAEVHFPSTELDMHIEVRCLVARGNEAWLSGPVTRSNRPDVNVGTVFVWRVVDNGEGSGAPPDRISNFLWRPTRNFHPRVCVRQPDLDTYAWDNGGVRILTTGSDLAPSDLEGTWDARSWVYTNLDRPGQVQDMTAMGVRTRLTVAADGRFSIVWWESGTVFENTSGTMEVVDGQVFVNPYEESPATLIAGRFGPTFWFDTDDTTTDFDGDGEGDPARLFASMRLKKAGTLIGDLVGEWEATEYRYSRVADPTQVVDMIAQGVTFTFIVEPDSRFTSVVNGSEHTSEFTVEGDEFLTRDVTLAFQLVDDEMTLEGLVDHDFGSGSEPATLELVLVRQP
jgi:hypothetical protein